MYRAGNERFDNPTSVAGAWRILWLLSVATLVVLSVATLAVLRACSGGPSTPVLVIHSAPEEGAEVSINGVPYGQTPATITTLTAGRQYYAVLEQYGYERKTQAIRIPEGGSSEVRVD